MKKTDSQDDQEEEEEEEEEEQEEEEVILSTSIISAETMSEPGSETMATHFKKVSNGIVRDMSSFETIQDSSAAVGRPTTCTWFRGTRWIY